MPNEPSKTSRGTVCSVLSKPERQSDQTKIIQQSESISHAARQQPWAHKYIYRETFNAEKMYHCGMQHKFCGSTQKEQFMQVSPPASLSCSSFVWRNCRKCLLSLVNLLCMIDHQLLETFGWSYCCTCNTYTHNTCKIYKVFVSFASMGSVCLVLGLDLITFPVRFMQKYRKL